MFIRKIYNLFRRKNLDESNKDLFRAHQELAKQQNLKMDQLQLFENDTEFLTLLKRFPKLYKHFEQDPEILKLLKQNPKILKFLTEELSSSPLYKHFDKDYSCIKEYIKTLSFLKIDKIPYDYGSVKSVYKSSAPSSSSSSPISKK